MYKQITVPIWELEFFEAQTKVKSDQKGTIQKKFVIQTMVIMNTKEATAHFWAQMGPGSNLFWTFNSDRSQFCNLLSYNDE